MRNILIDPVLLKIPANATTQDKYNYLSQLKLLCEAFFEMSDYDWHFSGSIAELLREEKVFPGFRLLREFLNDCNNQGLNLDLNANDLQRWINTLFEGAFDTSIDMANQSLLHYIDTDRYFAADVQKANTTFQPKEFSQRWDNSIQAEMKSLFARLCAYMHLKHEYVSDLKITTQVFNAEPARRDIDVSTTLEYLLGNGQIVPQPIAEKLALVVAPDDLEALLEDTDSSAAINNSGTSRALWKWDQTELGLRAAIHQECASRYRGWLGKPYKESQQQVLPLGYTFGSHFIEDLKNMSKSTAHLPRKVVEAIAAVIVDQVHEHCRFHAKQLRKSGGGGTEQRRRGDDKAWRVYVTVKRGGWRLNYWQGPDPNIPGHERVEFSIVQKKEDQEKIYDN